MLPNPISFGLATQPYPTPFGIGNRKTTPLAAFFD